MRSKNARDGCVYDWSASVGTVVASVPVFNSPIRLPVSALWQALGIDLSLGRRCRPVKYPSTLPKVKRYTRPFNRVADYTVEIGDRQFRVEFDDFVVRHTVREQAENALDAELRAARIGLPPRISGFTIRRRIAPLLPGSTIKANTKPGGLRRQHPADWRPVAVHPGLGHLLFARFRRPDLSAHFVRHGSEGRLFAVRMRCVRKNRRGD